ncbi:MAG: hypothetical protein RLZZ628_376 [Bacteroidota bacterium]|jgi:Uri superfamily endonuclease
MNYIKQWYKNLIKSFLPVISINGIFSKYKTIPVYSEIPEKQLGWKGKLNIGFAQNKAGVYIICENGIPVYVGKSESNLYKTISRHFQTWNDTNQPQRIVYDPAQHDYTVQITICNPIDVRDLEAELQKDMSLRDNKKEETVVRRWRSKKVIERFNNAQEIAPF